MLYSRVGTGAAVRTVHLAAPAADEDQASAGAQSALTALLPSWKAAVPLPLSRSMEAVAHTDPRIGASKGRGTTCTRAGLLAGWWGDACLNLASRHAQLPLLMYIPVSLGLRNSLHARRHSARRFPAPPAHCSYRLAAAPRRADASAAPRDLRKRRRRPRDACSSSAASVSPEPQTRSQSRRTRSGDPRGPVESREEGV